MRLFAALFVATAALAVPEHPAAFKRQLHTEALPLHLIPASCDAPCKYYKELFTTCSGNPGAVICPGACNGTLLTDLQVCINCVLVEGPGAGVIQFEIDLLNKAQQQLAQDCVDEQFPSSFSGSFPAPTTVAYPSGVINATFAPSGPLATAPPPVPTGSANASVSSSASGANASTPAMGAPTAGSGAGLTASISGALLLAAAAAAAL
ncbi:hypothetical protein CspHIS471_0703960 [Cutaneotrichosporon sp. HIS471]|nr:hypothetical protein CspHIS471_0703960 [Cutaneotrichosporon sp. HIS471]